MEKIACYCQSCRAANTLGETQCRNCGTRLLLVVFPQSLKFDTNHVPSYYEDHLLERVSLLELRLAQLTEQLAMAYEFIKREAKSIQKDRASLNARLENSNRTDSESFRLSESTRQPLIEKSKNQEAILQEIIDFQGKRQIELFSHLVKEGIGLLQKNEEKQAFQTLERAVLISPDNIPLNFFVAENLFRVDKFAEAKKYLENLFELDSQNDNVLLLLGAIYADQAQPDKARKMLSVLAEKPKAEMFVNYVWAMLAAFEKNWTESLAAFKQCLQKSETAEIRYLIGCVYFQMKDYENSLVYLEKANFLDAKFADAWFMQSVVYKLLKDKKNAAALSQAALESKEAGAQCLDFLKRQKEPNSEIALPFLHMAQAKNVLTKGSLRLNKFFREQIYKSLD